MRTIFLTATAVALIGLTACNRDDGETAEGPGQTEAVNAAQDAVGAAVGTVAGQTGAMTTDSFVGSAAVSDMYEVEAGKLASSMGKAAGVKSFGKMMAEGHTATTKELGPLAMKAGITPPKELDQRRAGFLDNLKAAGADFDRVYIDQQVAAHEEALSLMRNYADGGDNAEIKAFAAKTAPVVEQHLMKARELQSGGGSTTAPAK